MAKVLGDNERGVVKRSQLRISESRGGGIIKSVRHRVAALQLLTGQRSLPGHSEFLPKFYTHEVSGTYTHR